MSFRPRMQRRVLLVLAITVVIVGGLFGLRAMRLSKEAARIATVRETGMAAYARAEYDVAMPLLSEYLATSKTGSSEPTPEMLDALFAFADCRWRIPEQQTAHLVEARQRLEEYLTSRPNDEKAEHLQMDLHAQVRRYRDVISQADRLLSQHPDDQPALLAKATALYKQQRPALPEAQKTVDRLLAVAPENLRGLLLSMHILRSSGTSPADVVARAEQLRAANPGKVVFEVVAACMFIEMARGATGVIDNAQRQAWEGEARAAAKAAATHPSTDADISSRTVLLLDDTGQFPVALDYLRRAADAAPQADQVDALVRRLWQTNLFSEVVDRTAQLNPKAVTSRSNTLAYRAMSLLALAGQPSAGDARTRWMNQAEAITAELTARTSDVTAQAWMMLLNAGTTPAPPQTQPSAGEMVKRYRLAAEKDPLNAVTFERLAEALLATGEVEAAAQALETAAARQDDWSLPRARLAQLRLQSGRFAEAEVLAQEAFYRQPVSAQFALLLQARYANLGPSPASSAADQLLKDVDQLQKVVPNNPETLAIQVTLIAKRRSHQEAVARVEEALGADSPLPLNTLIQLQEVDRAEKLGLGDRLDAVASKRDGAALPLAEHQAYQKLEQREGAAGLQQLLAAQTKAGGESDPQWQLTVAAYRDRSGDPAAAAELRKLADQFAKNIQVQTQILLIPGARHDRELWLRTIDRIRGLSGDESTLWRVERAKWLLTGAPTAVELTESIALLSDCARRNPGSSEVHHLLGKALLEDGQRPKAVDELRAALSADASNANVGLDLVTALRLAKKNGDANDLLSRLTAGMTLSAEQRLRVARDYEEMGAPDLAIKALEAAPRSGAREALLGHLYRAVGRDTDADGAYKRLLNDDAAQPQDLFAGADFYAAAGDTDQAQLFLDRMKTMGQSASVTEMLLGQYDETYGSADSAQAHLTEATKLSPKSALAWKALTGFLLRCGKIDDARQAIATGIGSVGPSTELTAEQALIQLASTLPEPQKNPLVRYLSRDPSNVAATAMLKVLAEGQAALTAAHDGPSRSRIQSDLLLKLAALAEKYDDFWPLQEQVIRYYMRTDQPEKAAELAWRAIPSFPSQAEPARLAAEAYAQLRRWESVIEACTAWRQRSAGDTIPPDTMIAEALIAQKQPALAIQRLDGHIRANPLPTGSASTRPTVRPAIMALYRVYGQALIEAGRAADADAALKPMLSLGVDGRTTWLSVAGSHTKAAAARAWIEQGATSIPADADPLERIALADAWYQAGRSLGEMGLLTEAARVAEPLLAGDMPNPGAVRVSALIAYFAADYVKAEKYWRLLRDSTPEPTPDVLNNLAYMLLLRGDVKDLAEATKLADQALAASRGAISPVDRATYLGTLAKAQSSQGNRQQAIKTYRLSISADSQNIESTLGLADELSHGQTPDEKAEARRLFADARRLAEQSPAQPPEVQKQFDALRTTLETADTGR